MRYWMNGKEEEQGNAFKYAILCMTDDSVVLTTSKEQVQNIITILSKRYGPKLNRAKTKMIVDRSSKQSTQS